MAGTCYIITEGGKTHTFQQQQYLQQKKTDRKHSNHFSQDLWLEQASAVTPHCSMQPLISHCKDG